MFSHEDTPAAFLSPMYTDDPQPETTEPDDAAPSSVVRLSLISEVARFADGAAVDSAGNGRPIHAMRAGTWTDMSGRETTFTPENIQTLADNLNASAARRKPPITEMHNYGRAFGRILSAETRRSSRDLYIIPRWNAEGRRLLEDEVYDGFSAEIDLKTMTLVGGTLTNYPAIHGLQPVRLSAPPLAPESIQEVPPMADEPTTPTPTPDAAPAVAPPDVPIPAPPVGLADDPMIAQQIAAYQAQMTAYMRRMHEEVMAQAQRQAQVDFERWRSQQAAEQAITLFAQHATTPTMERPHALAYTAEQVVTILSGLSAEKRRQIETLITDVLSGTALVAYDSIGATGAGNEDVRGQWESAVSAFRAQGLSASEAIKAAQKNHPTLYQQYNALGKGGR